MLLDTDRFCYRCGAAQSARPPQPIPRIEPGARETALEDVIHDLESKLAKTVPKEEADSLRTRLQGVQADADRIELLDKISKLETKLAESAPRDEVRRLYVEVEELE